MVKRSELVRRAHALSALVRIGKSGITDSVVLEITKQLKKHKLVKIKLLQSFDGDKKEAAKELAGLTESTLVQQVGGTVVLWKA